MTEHHKNWPEFYLTAPQACPYLEGRFERKLFTHLTHDKAPEVVDRLLRGGFRRSHNIAYMPHCDDCQACQSVRVVAGEFEPGRTFRRVVRRNDDLVAKRVSARPTAEQYSIFRAYIDARHGDGGMADMSVLDFAMMIEDSVVDSFVTEYRVRRPGDLAGGQASGPLVAVTLCDRLSDGISMVYSFYDPEADQRRSLGTYMILEHLAYARRVGLPYVYLGYYIGQSAKMAYKKRFQPIEVLTLDGWQRRDLEAGGDAIGCPAAIPHALAFIPRR